MIRTVGGRVAGNALEFVAYVVFARRLGPAVFGVLSVMLVATRFLALLGDSGAAFGGTREAARRGLDDAELWAWQQRREHRSLLLAGIAALGAVAVGHPEVAPMALGVLARGANRDWIAIGLQDRRGGVAPGWVHGLVLLPGAAVAATDVQAAGTVALGRSRGPWPRCG
ncbi:MAG: hypothetical protein R2698_12465 [Microthrixaceae bacterium]